jgi:hypothetical protein
MRNLTLFSHGRAAIWTAKRPDCTPPGQKHGSGTKRNQAQCQHGEGVEHKKTSPGRALARRACFAGAFAVASGLLLVTARIFLVFVMVTALADPAWAYIDPNAGGLIFQIAMPILTLGLAGLAFLRNRIIAFVKKLFRVRMSSVQADQHATEE